MRKDFSLSKKTLAWLLAALLLLSLLPLYGISFYNHAFYDDFGFSIKSHAAWRDTGSLGAVLRAAVDNTLGTRNTWEGTYATTFLSTLQPALWGEDFYWITTFVLLTGLLLALGFFVRQALFFGLHADRPACVITFCSLAFLLTQMLPSPSEAFFWFNGGVAYTLLWSFLLVSAGAWLALDRCACRVKSGLLFALLALLTVLVGGGKYSTVLLALLLAASFTLWAFVRQRPKKWLFLLLTLLLSACLAFSAAAPGNGVRAQTLQGGMSAPMAILQAFYFGFALMGSWFSLPLAAVVGVSVLALLPALRQCSHRFPRPLWVSLLFVCLFCAQLAPTLFTGNYLGDGRALNTYYDTYVLMVCGLAVYWTGWALRQGSAQKPTLLEAPVSSRLRGSALAVAAVLLVVGFLAFQPEGSPSYGPQNTAAGSALLSLLKGEAQQYDREMDARDMAMNDPAQPSPMLTPVSVLPRVFMSDAAGGSASDYVLSLYAEYYAKETVSLAPAGEASPDRLSKE